MLGRRSSDLARKPLPHRAAAPTEHGFCRFIEHDNVSTETLYAIIGFNTKLNPAANSRVIKFQCMANPKPGTHSPDINKLVPDMFG